MDALFYFYTILIMGLCTVTASVALSAFFVSRRKTYLFATIGFLAYFLELAYTFQFEFTGWNLDYPSELMYGVQHPVLQTLLALGVLQPAWLALCDYVNERRRAILWIPAVAFFLICVATVTFLPEGPLSQWLYYTWRQVFIAGILAFILLRIRRGAGTLEALRLRRLRPLLVATLVLILCITTEDAVVIFVLSPDLLAQADLLPLYASERNFFENVLLILFAVFMLRMAAKTLRLRFKEPPAADNPDLPAYVDELVPAYGERYGLSLREQEILIMLLQGKDNQNIASELQVALGTVKTHVHNILKKTGTASRQEVVLDFWKG